MPKVPTLFDVRPIGPPVPLSFACWISLSVLDSGHSFSASFCSWGFCDKEIRVDIVDVDILILLASFVLECSQECSMIHHDDPSILMSLSICGFLAPRFHKFHLFARSTRLLLCVKPCWRLRPHTSHSCEHLDRLTKVCMT